MQEKLAKMQAKMGQYKGGYGGEYWKPPEGTTKIRILPQKGNMEFFFQVKGTHTIKVGRDDKTVVCPLFTSEGTETCPICEYAELLNQEDNKKLAEKYKVRRQFIMNIIVRGDAKVGTEDKVWIWTPGVKVFEDLTAIVNNPDYGDITDIYNGFDLSVTREGQKLETSYKIVPRRNSSPIYVTPEGEADEAAIKTAMKAIPDHSKILDKLPSRDEILEETGLDDLAEEDELPTRTVKNRKSAVEDEYQEFDEEDL